MSDDSVWDEDVPLGEQIDETLRRRKEALTERVNREDDPEKDGPQRVRQDESSHGSKLPSPPVPRSASASERLRELGAEFRHREIKGQPETYRTYNVSLAAAIRTGNVLPLIADVVEEAERRVPKDANAQHPLASALTALREALGIAESELRK